MITGQLFFRETAQEAPDKPDHKLLMVVGIIAVPNDSKLCGEHQYVVTGKERSDCIAIAAHTRLGVDRTDMARGLGLGSLVTQPIWRV